MVRVRVLTPKIVFITGETDYTISSPHGVAMPEAGIFLPLVRAGGAILVEPFVQSGLAKLWGYHVLADACVECGTYGHLVNDASSQAFVRLGHIRDLGNLGTHAVVYEERLPEGYWSGRIEYTWPRETTT